MTFNRSSPSIRPSFNVTWHLGNSKHYDPTWKNSAWTHNLLCVLDDMKQFVRAGHLSELWMPNMYHGDDIRDCMLCYIPALLVKDESRFVEAVMTGNAEFDVFECGYIVYSRNFANGTLRAFFADLDAPTQLAILRSRL